MEKFRKKKKKEFSGVKIQSKRERKSSNPAEEKRAEKQVRNREEEIEEGEEDLEVARAKVESASVE